MSRLHFGPCSRHISDLRGSGRGDTNVSRQLKFWSFVSCCQLSVKWLLMINYETYLNIFDAKFGLKGTYNVN